MLQAGRSLVEFPMRSLDISIDLMLPAAYNETLILHVGDTQSLILSSYIYLTGVSYFLSFKEINKSRWECFPSTQR
jgi:hypothetical protein